MPELSRRGFLRNIATGAMGAIAAASSLKPAYSSQRSRPIPFGSAARTQFIEADGQYRDSLLRYCSRLTPEIEFKWDQIEPRQGQFSFEAADTVANFARDHGKEIYGHTLLWHRSMPPWLPDHLRETRAWSTVTGHIGRMVGRYAGVRYWDVVNEPIDTGFRDDGLRPSVFLDCFGADYIATALQAAWAASPGAELLINEYGLEYDLTVEHDRRYHFLRLLERLKKGGAPIGGIGLQAHLDLRKGPVSQAAISSFLKEIRNLGLFVFVSELDVTEADYVMSAVERDAKVGAEVARYLDVVCDFEDLRGVATWGLTDRYSWLGLPPEEVEAYKQHGYWRDGTSPGFNRGLPLDTDLRPKPFLDALKAHGVGQF